MKKPDSYSPIRANSYTQVTVTPEKITTGVINAESFSVINQTAGEIIIQSTKIKL